MASNPEVVTVQIAGHEIRLTATDEERVHIERAAAKVNESIRKLQVKLGGAASASKVHAMVAFQFAYELSMADEMLADAQRLHDHLASEKEAVKRLEGLLVRVDDALAY